MATKPFSSGDMRYPCLTYTDEVVEENMVPTSAYDATGALRVTQQSPIVAVEFHYAVNPVFVTPSIVTTGTVTQANSMAVLQTGAGAAGSAIIQSLAAARYLGGSSMFASWTAIYSPPKLSSQQVVGALTAVDGFGFGYLPGTTNFGIVRRSGGVDNFIPQSTWNVDPFDGSGPSGLVLNQFTGNVYKCQYLWHGYGPIRFYVNNGDSWQLAHTLLWANANTVPSILNPTLPLRAEVFNAGNTTNLTLRTASMGIYVEGYDGTGQPPQISSNGSFGNNKTAITAESSVLTLKNKPTNILGGTNTSQVRVKLTQVSLVSAAGATLFRLLINSTLGGSPSFTDWSTTTSVIQTDTAGTTTGGTGSERFRYFDPSGTGSPQSFDISHLNILLNPGDTVTLAASGSSVNPNCSIQWQELF